jgi:hypothetical protein
VKKRNQRNIHGVVETTFFSSVLSRLSRTEPLGVSIKRSLLAASFAAVVSASAWAAQLPDAVASDSPRTAMGTPASVTASSSSGEAAPLLIGQTDEGLDPEAVAHTNWSALMVRTPSPDAGCFHASYPNIVWERVPCKIGQPRTHPTPVKPPGDADVAGNGHDYVAGAQASRPQPPTTDSRRPRQRSRSPVIGSG